MKILIVLAHPDPSSFNHALAGAVSDALLAAGHDVSLRDLYSEKFDPVIPAGEIPSECELPANIAGWCAELSDAEGIVIVHPNWWGQPPAILKGWIDRVIRPGVAYRFVEGDSGEGVPEGLLKARTALVLNTANTPAEREEAAFGDPLGRTWADCIFGLCGVADVRRRTFAVVVTSTPEERAAWLREAAVLALECFGSHTTLRHFVPEDLGAVERLIDGAIDSAYAGVYPERAIAYFKNLHSAENILARAQRGAVLVAERDGNIIGTGSLVDSEIGGVFVRREARGQGIGSWLMDELEGLAAAAGSESLSLSVSLPSREFYARRGYSVSEMLSGDMGEGQTLDYWEGHKALGMRNG